MFSAQKIALEQEKAKASSLAEQLKDLMEDQKLAKSQHEAIEKTLNEKILYLNEKITNLNKKNEEFTEKSLKEIQEKNSVISSLMKKIEVFIFYNEDKNNSYRTSYSKESPCYSHKRLWIMRPIISKK